MTAIAEKTTEPKLIFDNQKMSLARFLWLHFIVSRRIDGFEQGDVEVTLADGHYWSLIERKGVYCKVTRPGVGVRTVYTAEINIVRIRGVDNKS